MNQKLKNKLLALLCIAIGFGISQAVTHFYLKNSVADTSEIKLIRESVDGEYAFIKPLLVCKTPQDEEELELEKTKRDAQAYIFSHTGKDQIYSISFYLRDLDPGHWVGINQDDPYNPASLLKVPFMIGFLKESEDDPNLLKQTIVYESILGGESEFNTLQSGSKYPIGTLIEAMIQKSDNGATALLSKNIEEKSFFRLFEVLGLPIPTSGLTEYFISPRDYSLFFRVLYNATYLTRENSEEALEILEGADFNQGITTKLPPTLKVAHKFGQYKIPNTNAWEFSDCGIVYHPSGPYFVCVMSKGENLENLKKITQDLSDIAYRNYSANQSE